MVILTEEVGELAMVTPEPTVNNPFKESDKNIELADEMADVLWVLLPIPANQTGVNLTDAFEKNIEKKTLRDSSRHLQNKKLRQ